MAQDTLNPLRAGRSASTYAGAVGVVLRLTVGVPPNCTAGKLVTLTAGVPEMPTVPVTVAFTLPCTGSGVFVTLTGTLGTVTAAATFGCEVWAPTGPGLSETNVAPKTTKPNVRERDFANRFMVFLLVWIQCADNPGSKP